MIIDLGLIDYERAYRLQKELVGRRKMGGACDSIIFAEHYPVFTIGRAGKKTSLIIDESVLDKYGIKVLNVDRGGDITFHGPGQLVIYPVVDLTAHGRDLHRYLRLLEEAAIRSLAGYSISADRIEGKTGAWVSGKKIASIGIAAADWITYHGISINVNVDLQFFSMIRPCGMENIEMTSMACILRKNIDIDTMKRNVFSELKALLNLREDRFGSFYPYERYPALA
ncbi:MAG: lipoyl(octanoyl) transferase LipB [Candidatus Omnitrophota bacterium]|nr:lipoyl(octanoyl) transferase LipB [Candidatus Omnitrophota bacterium]